jgi:TRAP-type C4-dicarboxylate transport system permease small subunit
MDRSHGETDQQPRPPSRRGFSLLVERATRGWALAGGVALLGVVFVNTWSVASAGIGGPPFAGAFELTELGTAVAIFTFLPHCQLVGANVTADIFTARASRRTVAAFSLLAAVCALGFALLLAQRMYLGLLDQKAFGYATTILAVPIWWAFAVAVASLLLLALAASVSLVEAGRELAEG